MSSITLTLSGDTSSLTSYFHPEIVLDERYSYSCGLLDFSTYNSIPNVHAKNNKFYFKKDPVEKYDIIEIPVGSYEIDDIGAYITKKLSEFSRGVQIRLFGNKNIMKCVIETSVDISIDFSKPDNIGELLGFNAVTLNGSKSYQSDKTVTIQNISNIRIECDLTSGSYHNGKSTHTIYEFNPTTNPGYKIIEKPKNLIYLPMIRHRINSVNISVVDQNNNQIDFREEQITCRIHIKRDN